MAREQQEDKALSYMREYERAVARRDAIVEAIKSFSDGVLLDVVDCEMVIADGLARNGDLSGVRGGSVSRPTESAALRLAGSPEVRDAEGNLVREAQPDTWEERERDVIAEAVNELLGSLAEAAGALVRAKRQIPVITDAGAHLRGRKSTIDQCRACLRDVLGTREDRIVHGYCGACDKAWTRAGRPHDRFAWENERRALLDERERKGDGGLADAI